MAAAQAQGLDWTLLAAQGYAESGFNPKAVSYAGAQGIAQFMPGTWPQWGKGDPFNPADAIPAQAAFMKWLMDYMRSKGKNPPYDWAIMGYLHGPAGALKYSSLSSFPAASQGYLNKIKSQAAQYRAL